MNDLALKVVLKILKRRRRNKLHRQLDKYIPLFFTRAINEKLQTTIQQAGKNADTVLSVVMTDKMFKKKRKLTQ